jgi:type IV fimbrial biogenesis protein FimT
MASVGLFERSFAAGARKKPRGFTLVELMITLTVLAILLSIAVPSFQNITNRNRVVAAANELVAAVQMARMEAVRRNRRVALCPSTDGSTCSGSNWNRLILFVDSDADGEKGAGDEVIRDEDVGSANLVVQGSTKLATNNRIWFGSDGLARLGNPAANSGSISVCSAKLPTAGNTRDVLIAVSRISVSTRSAAECAVLND